MPIVVTDGNLRFIINTRENLFETPHVHVYFGNQSICRIRLLDGTFMEEPPSGTAKRIASAYLKHTDLIQERWDSIHGR